MRIYKIYTEHKQHGHNYDSYKVAAETCEQAIARVKKEFGEGERLQSIELLASTD